MEASSEQKSMDERPAIFMIGSSNVGKRTLLSRLLSVDLEDFSDDSSSQLLVHGWTINTKYYTADVSVWMAHLHDEFSIASLPVYPHLNALVMVFDITDLSSLAALQDWVSRTDIHRFHILLCVGNKVDLIPGHPVHAEYRRRLQNLGESSADPHPDYCHFGISETEGTSLLGEEEEDPSLGIRSSCLQWCTDHNIEFIEACASNVDFDKCLSVDGDSQGVERIYGALSAHMWPGMILKSGNKITEPSLPDKEESSEEESDYEFDYEVLSGGSAEPYDDTYGRWVSANVAANVLETGGSVSESNSFAKSDQKIEEKFAKDEVQPLALEVELQDRKGMVPDIEESEENREPNEVAPFDFEDLEQLMSEISNARDGLRLMPDFQRREMAANLAMKMAAMFGGGSDDDGEFD